MAKQRQASRERFITTIEHGNPDLLLVALPILGQRAITKTLRRANNETNEAFMARVVRWRDRAWRQVHGSAVPARSFHANARANSTTGIPGVRVIDKRVRKGTCECIVPCVIAQVHTIPGKDYARPSGSRTRLYSLNVYELEEAIALAAAWRAAQIAMLTRAHQRIAADALR